MILARTIFAAIWVGGCMNAPTQSESNRSGLVQGGGSVGPSTDKQEGSGESAGSGSGEGKGSGAPNDEGSDAGKDDGDDDFKQAGNPQNVTGVNLVDFGDARVRCDFAVVSDVRYDVSCGVVKLIGNKEVVPSGITEGVALSWSPAQFSRANVATASCTTAPTKLSQTCEVTLVSANVTLEVSQTLTIAKAAKQRTETGVAHLPYSVGVAAGFVPQIPFRYLKQPAGELSLTGDTTEVRRGMQRIWFDENRGNLDSMETICFRGPDKAFIGTFPHIYEWDVANKKMSVYAGRSNGADDLSHRYRTKLVASQITCMPDHLIVSDAGNQRLLRIWDKGEVEVLYQSPNAHWDYSNTHPLYGHAIATDETIFFVDSTRNVVMKMPKNGEASIIAGIDGQGGIGANEIPALQSALGSPYGIALTPTGDLLVAEASNHRVRRIDAQGTIHAFAGDGLFIGDNGDGGQAVDAHVIAPRSIFLSPGGDVYIAEQDVLRKVDVTGKISTVDSHPFFGFAWLGQKLIATMQQKIVSYDVDNVQAVLLDQTWQPSTRTEAAGDDLWLNSATAAAFDSSGKMLLRGVDSYAWESDQTLKNFRQVNTFSLIGSPGRFSPDAASFVGAMQYQLKRYTRSGSVAIAGTQGQFGYVDAPIANQGKIGRIGSIAPLADGSVYFMDGALSGTTGQTNANSVLRHLTVGGALETIAGATQTYANPNTYRQPANSPDGTASGAVQLDLGPLAVGPGEKIYLSQNGKIRTFDSERKIRTIAGGGTDDETDGLGSLAIKVTPGALTATTNGWLYYIDKTRNTLRVLKPNPDANSPSPFIVQTVVKQRADQDCGTGLFNGEGEDIRAVDSAIHANLTAMCIGTLVDVSSRDTCGSPNGKLSLAVVQRFGFNDAFNVLVIEEPCL